MMMIDDDDDYCDGYEDDDDDDDDEDWISFRIVSTFFWHNVPTKLWERSHKVLGTSSQLVWDCSQNCV